MYSASHRSLHLSQGTHKRMHCSPCCTYHVAQMLHRAEGTEEEGAIVKKREGGLRGRAFSFPVYLQRGDEQGEKKHATRNITNQKNK